MKKLIPSLLFLLGMQGFSNTCNFVNNPDFFLDKVIKKIQDLKAEIQSKKVTWSTVEKQDKYNFSVKERFKKLVKTDAIPGIGINKELMDQIFALKVDGFLERNDATGYYLIAKTSEIPFTQATFENSKERVRLELAHEYADKQLGITQ